MNVELSSLKNQIHFDLVNKHGYKLRSPYFIIISSPNWHKHTKRSKRNNIKKHHLNYNSIDLSPKIFEVKSDVIMQDEIKTSETFNTQNHSNVTDPSLNSLIGKNSGDHLPASINLGIKANKKLGNAVIRNKIKRRIKHLIRLMLNQYSFPDKFGIIIIPYKGFEKVEFASLAAACSKIFGKVLKSNTN